MDDKSYRICILNSNKLEDGPPWTMKKGELEEHVLCEEAMRNYPNNEELLALKETVEKGTLFGEKAKRFVVLCGALYYISKI